MALIWAARQFVYFQGKNINARKSVHRYIQWPQLTIILRQSVQKNETRKNVGERITESHSIHSNINYYIYSFFYRFISSYQFLFGFHVSFNRILFFSVQAHIDQNKLTRNDAKCALGAVHIGLVRSFVYQQPGFKKKTESSSIASLDRYL